MSDNLKKIWDQCIIRYNNDIGLQYAKEKVYLNKSDEEVATFFENDGFIARMDELNLMSDELFNHYFYHFHRFILSGNYDHLSKHQIANCFMTLLITKLEEKAIKEVNLFNKTTEIVDFFGSNLPEFNDSKEIFGDLTVQISNARALMKEYDLNRLG